MSNASNGLQLDNAPNVADVEEEGVVIHLKDEAGELMYFGEEGNRQPVTWTVCGSYSPTARKLEKKQTGRLLKRARRGQDIDVDDTEQNQIEKASGCTKAWAGIFVTKGEPMPCNPENAAAILASPKAPHIRRQVLDAMEDHARFFARS